MVMDGTQDEEFCQAEKATDQVFGFALCGRFDLKSVLERAADLWSKLPPQEAPNIIVSLEDGFLVPMLPKSLTHSAHGAVGIAFVDEAQAAFRHLMIYLLNHIRRGRSVDLMRFNTYLLAETGTEKLKLKGFLPFSRTV